jgi:hypothetical protein
LFLDPCAFNPDKKHLPPVDLSGWNFKLYIYLNGRPDLSGNASQDSINRLAFHTGGLVGLSGCASQTGIKLCPGKAGTSLY